MDAALATSPLPADCVGVVQGWLHWLWLADWQQSMRAVHTQLLRDCMPYGLEQHTVTQRTYARVYERSRYSIEWWQYGYDRDGMWRVAWDPPVRWPLLGDERRRPRPARRIGEFLLLAAGPWGFA